MSTFLWKSLLTFISWNTLLLIFVIRLCIGCVIPSTNLFFWKFVSIWCLFHSFSRKNRNWGYNLLLLWIFSYSYIETIFFTALFLINFSFTFVLLCLTIKISFNISWSELFKEYKAMKISVDSIFISRHKCKKFWHYVIICIICGDLLSFNGYLLRENKFEIVCHFTIRLIHTKKYFRLNVTLIRKFLVNNISESCLWKTSNKEVLY